MSDHSADADSLFIFFKKAKVDVCLEFQATDLLLDLCERQRNHVKGLPLTKDMIDKAKR